MVEAVQVVSSQDPGLTGILEGVGEAIQQTVFPT